MRGSTDDTSEPDNSDGQSPSRDERSPTATRAPTSVTHNIGETYVTQTDMALTVTDIRPAPSTDRDDVRVYVEATNQSDTGQSAPYFSDYYVVAGGNQYGSNNFTSYQDNTRDLQPDLTGSGYIAYAFESDITVDDVDRVVLVLDSGTTVNWTTSNKN